MESINHAKAAGVTVIVAINKMDKPTANPTHVMEQLTQYELVPEEWGGDTICVPVSALTGQGIEDLLENINLVAEVKELKANPNRRAKGVVIEARLDKGMGPVATILVQKGTLHQGDIVIAGTAVGRVRVMRDDQGRTLKRRAPLPRWRSPASPRCLRRAIFLTRWKTRNWPASWQASALPRPRKSSLPAIKR